MASASVAGPTFAALVLSVASWPWLFVVQLPFGLFVWLLGRRSLPANLSRETVEALLNTRISGKLIRLTKTDSAPPQAGSFPKRR